MSIWNNGISKVVDSREDKADINSGYVRFYTHKLSTRTFIITVEREITHSNTLARTRIDGEANDCILTEATHQMRINVGLNHKSEFTCIRAEQQTVTCDTLIDLSRLRSVKSTCAS